jgi:hypothetical protein
MILIIEGIGKWNNGARVAGNRVDMPIPQHVLI